MLKNKASKLQSLLSSAQCEAMRRHSRGLDKKPGKTDNQGQDNTLTTIRDRTTLPQLSGTGQHSHNYQGQDNRLLKTTKDRTTHPNNYEGPFNTLSQLPMPGQHSYNYQGQENTLSQLYLSGQHTKNTIKGRTTHKTDNQKQNHTLTNFKNRTTYFHNSRLIVFQTLESFLR